MAYKEYKQQIIIYVWLFYYFNVCLCINTGASALDENSIHFLQLFK